MFAREGLHFELEEWHVDAGPAGFYTDRAVASHNAVVWWPQWQVRVRVPNIAVMAAGSRGRYALDLDDIMAFPDAKHIPVLPPQDGESWYFIFEVSLRAQRSFLASLKLRSCKREDHDGLVKTGR